MPWVDQKFAEAMQALDQADFDTAIESLSAVLAEKPQHAEAWAQLGVCYLETGQGQRALEALERAAQADPGSAQIQYLLGVAHGAAGQIDRALACFQKALQLDPAHQKAEEFRVRAQALLESRQHYKNALALLKEKSQADYAARALREILLSIGIFPQSPARDELGYCVRQLQKSLRDVYYETDPAYQFLPWFEACGNGYQALRLLNFAAAREWYEKAATLRDDPFVLHGLALALYGAGEPESALRVWKQLLERNPDFDLGTLARVLPPTSRQPA
jgi:tetratricopeptide (TPR) repeat protein